jgi:outer membrane cobalamin receptor
LHRRGCRTIAAVGASAVTANVLGLNKAKQTDRGNLALQNTPQAALVNAASTFGAINPVYGSRRIGGIRILTELSGSSNEYLNLVIAWGAGPWNAISTVYLDDIAITDAQFAGLVTYENYTGTDTQAASAALIAELPASGPPRTSCAAWRTRGCASSGTRPPSRAACRW